jgi:hypothetical protein
MFRLGLSEGFHLGALPKPWGLLNSEEPEIYVDTLVDDSPQIDHGALSAFAAAGKLDGAWQWCSTVCAARLSPDHYKFILPDHYKFILLTPCCNCIFKGKAPPKISESPITQMILQHLPLRQKSPRAQPCEGNQCVEHMKNTEIECNNDRYLRRFRFCPRL